MPTHLARYAGSHNPILAVRDRIISYRLPDASQPAARVSSRKTPAAAARPARTASTILPTL